MPRWDVTSQFERDLKKLSAENRSRFEKVLKTEFVPDLRAGAFRRGLGVKGVVAARGVFEMRWAPDGRCTFEYGPESVPGNPHIIWRRIGTHDIYKSP